eukprot:1438196-Rhodomonas_salina.1
MMRSRPDVVYHGVFQTCSVMSGCFRLAVSGTDGRSKSPHLRYAMSGADVMFRATPAKRSTRGSICFTGRRASCWRRRSSSQETWTCGGG